MREASRTLLYRHDYVTTKNTLEKSAAYKANQQIMICTFKRLYARRGFNVRSPFPHLPGTEMSDESKDKPVLLKAVELVLANPKDIQREAQSLVAKFTAKHEDKSADQVRKLVAKKIISNYSYYSAFVGGATALAGVVPGLGTAIATFGGATADAALSMKYQIEMTMALASVYGHNILLEKEKRIYMVIAGLGAINEAAKGGGKAVGYESVCQVGPAIPRRLDTYCGQRDI